MSASRLLTPSRAVCLEAAEGLQDLWAVVPAPAQSCGLTQSPRVSYKPNVSLLSSLLSPKRPRSCPQLPLYLQHLPPAVPQTPCAGVCPRTFALPMKTPPPDGHITPSLDSSGIYPRPKTNLIKI